MPDDALFEQVEYTLCFSAAETAEQVGRELDEKGYEVEVAASAGSTWEVHVRWKGSALRARFSSRATLDATRRYPQRRQSGGLSKQRLAREPRKDATRAWLCKNSANLTAQR